MKRKFAGGGFDKLKFTGFVCLFLFVITCTMANIVLAALSTGIEGGFSVIYDIPQDLWDNISRIFDKNNVNKLLWHISGDSTATVDNMAPIEALAATKLTSADMIANYSKVNPASADEDLSAYANSASADAAYYSSANAASASDYLISANSASSNDEYSVSAKSNDAEIIVTLGGLKWTPVYLSTTNEGKDNEPHDVILTLWLADNQQDAWADRKADEGEYYGFIDGALYSDFAADWYNGYYNLTEDPYPSDMYGTSYIRAVTHNNGGVYATSGTETATAKQNESNVFALFTMSQFGLTDFLVTPEHVSWQESGQSLKEIGFDYNVSNENWGDRAKVPSDGFRDDAHNFAGKEGNDTWKNDYLWIPSFSETGCADKLLGIWQTSMAQMTLNKKQVSGDVGSANGTDNGSVNGGDVILSRTWLRSDDIETRTNSVYALTPWTYGCYYVVDSHAVRPALHLNLTEVAKSLKK